MTNIKKYFCFLLLVLSMTRCTQSPKSGEHYLADDIRLFKGTKAWKLAEAVEKGDTTVIAEIALKNTSLLNFHEKYLGFTPLLWAVYNDHLTSAKSLLECGAKPNLQCKSGETALIFAADKYETSDYVRLLLKYGGNVNKTVDSTSPLRSPLIAAAKQRLESVELLVNAGADVNYMSTQYESALHEACIFDRIEIVRYLIIDCSADFKHSLGKRLNGETIYIMDYIKDMNFDSEPSRNKIKMEVIDFMKEHGA